MQPRAVIYTRVSTEKQAGGTSLDIQEEACRKFVESKLWVLDAVFREEGESAKTLDRPEFQKMQRYVARKNSGINVLVVYDLSRFSRDTADHLAVRAYLRNHGVELQTVVQPLEDTSSGRFLETILSAVGQFDNDQRRDKTVLGMQQALRDGYWQWKAPIGYVNSHERHNAIPSPHPVYGPLLRQALIDFSTGGYTKRGLLDRLNAQGMLTPRGNPLTPQTFHACFTNKFYAGIVASPKYQIEAIGKHEALITFDVYDRNQQVLSGKRGSVKGGSKAHDSEDFPLRRFVRCGICKMPLTASFSTGRSERYGYYHCRGYRDHGALSVRKEVLESMFLDEVRRITPEPKMFRLFQKVVQSRYLNLRMEAESLSKRNAGELQQIRDKKSRLLDGWMSGVISDGDFKGERSKLEDSEQRIMQRTVDGVAISKTTLDDLLRTAEDVLRNPAKLWENGDLTTRLRIQAVLFPQKLTFADEKFGTVVTARIFSELIAHRRVENDLASPTGFEPVSPP
ncbi:MAG: recombinase family protein [Thermoanaerobaculia bacterium]